MKTFGQFIFEEMTQEKINKLIKKLETLTDEKEIIQLKSKIEFYQEKLSKN